jgi:hypothetical protein
VDDVPAQGGRVQKDATTRTSASNQLEASGAPRTIYSRAKRPSELGIAAIVLLALLATVLFAVSFLVADPPGPIVASGHLGPISTASNQPRYLRLTGTVHPKHQESFDVKFRFKTTSLVGNDTLFEVGSGKSALQTLVDPGVGGGRSLVVKVGLADGSTLTAVLLDHVVLSRTYAVEVATGHGRSLTGRVNGVLQFEYTYPSNAFTGPIKQVVVGGGGGGSQSASAFPGSVRGFTLSYRTFGSIPSHPAQLIMRLVAGASLVIALALLVLRIATDARVENAAVGRPRSRLPALSIFKRHQGFIGLLLVGGGIAMIASLTPPDNSDAQRSDYQHIASVPVSPGTWVGTDYGSAPPLLNPAKVVDVDLSFEMRIAALPIPQRHFSSVVVAAAGGNRGIQFNLSPQGELSGLIGERYATGPVIEILSARVPVGKWIKVAVNVQRNQSFKFSVNGQQESAFVYAGAALNALPTGLSAGGGPSGTFGGSIRDLTMSVSVYNSSTVAPNHDVRRGGQLLGILGVVVGVVLLCRRWLARSIPAVTSAARPLVVIVFGTTGILVLVDLIFSLLHFEPNLGPSVARNTWLFTPLDRFSDFTQVLGIFKSFNPYGLQDGSYPPVGYWLVAPVSWMSYFAALYVYLAVFVGFTVWWCWRSFASSLRTIEGIVVVIIAFMSLPISFALDRGNVDLWVFILLVFGVAALERRKNALAASWIGLIAAAKIVPVIYLVAFVRRGGWRYILLAIVVAVVATTAAFASFHGSILENFRGFRHAVSALEQQDNYLPSSTYYNSSIYGWAQAIGYGIGGLHGSLLVRVAIAPYVLPGEIAGVLLLAWYLRRHEQSLWRAMTLMTLWFLLLQDVAYYYQLLFLFVPLALFIKHSAVNRRSVRIACLYGLILAPKSYFFFGNSLVDSSVLLTAPLLVALMIGVISDGQAERREARTSGTLTMPDLSPGLISVTGGSPPAGRP